MTLGLPRSTSESDAGFELTLHVLLRTAESSLATCAWMWSVPGSSPVTMTSTMGFFEQPAIFSEISSIVSERP